MVESGDFSRGFSCNNSIVFLQFTIKNVIPTRDFRLQFGDPDVTDKS